MQNELIIKWLFKFLKVKYNKKKIDLYFMNEKYIDSLKIFELISIIEKKFNIKISLNDLQKNTTGTIKGMANLINEKINRKKISK
jgi:acyl carrier protein|tara:strand:- start:3050 stop:3304 length:255 start_codon:yes stop_codon:yes gene_type:complete